jgi:hypothetical protein
MPPAPIDSLLISLTNNAAPCCRNPMGLDNIVMARWTSDRSKGDVDTQDYGTDVGAR